MKHIHNKYIRLTEQDLHRIVRENVQKELNILLEYYALNKSDFQEKVYNQIIQIVENWCLIKYCTLTNTDVNNCKNHWKVELRTAFKNAAFGKLKGNDSVQSRYKAIKSTFDKADISDYEQVEFVIRDKFIAENISINSEEYIEVINLFIKNIDNIIECIAAKDYYEYVENL